MIDAVQIVTTTQTRDEAERIARTLIQRRLAACVQLEGPITSFFNWQGRLDVAEEYRLAVKTRQHLFEQVQAAIREEHSYDVPELIVLPITHGSDDYLRWLEQETAAESA